jgi:hypothetical protein
MSPASAALASRDVHARVGDVSNGVSGRASVASSTGTRRPAALTWSRSPTRRAVILTQHRRTSECPRVWYVFLEHSALYAECTSQGW